MMSRYRLVTHQVHVVIPLLDVSCDRHETAVPHLRHSSTLLPLLLDSFARLPRDSNRALVRHRGTLTVFISLGAGAGGGGGGGVCVLSGVRSTVGGVDVVLDDR